MAVMDAGAANGQLSGQRVSLTVTGFNNHVTTGRPVSSCPRPHRHLCPNDHPLPLEQDPVCHNALNQSNAELEALLGAKTAEADCLTGRVTELEDELTAARTSLRQMIKNQSKGAAPST
ncbi:hypothetical protein AB0D14_40885 [Streptomyces sp. NPDC048484]|uniref:hypothetical protein n=1 Tax=Streptomyces sp. NPDC048484 TaxID=3155146 RepID=UPI003418FBBE